MAGPIHPELLRRSRPTRRFLALSAALGTAHAGTTVLQAWLIAQTLTGIVTDRSVAPWLPQITALAVISVVRAGLTWLQQPLAHRSASTVKSRLRLDILTARLSRPRDPRTTTGKLVTLVTSGVEALDGYYAKYLPQLVLAGTVPMIIGAAILLTDGWSAVIIAATLPLIPIFMILVGLATRARLNRGWQAQSRLAHHFADLIAGLPTLQVFGRARAQADPCRSGGLAEVERRHRRSTMSTLRVSLLSTLVLELVATLSVALVAVSVGLRVVNAELSLQVGLFVLMLAPEVFLPVRLVGTHFHDAADGVAAAEDAFALIGRSAPDEPTGAIEVPDPSTAAIRVERVRVRHPGAEVDGLPELGCLIRPGEVVALTGPSGCGKSTALDVLTGLHAPTSGRVLIGGVPLAELPRRAWLDRVAMVAQDPGMINGSITDNVLFGHPTADAWSAARRRKHARTALALVGATELDPARMITELGAELSAGERRRIALARAVVRVRDGRARLLVLDEPTAGLDDAAELSVIRLLARLGVTTVIVSHRPAVLVAVDRCIAVGERRSRPRARRQGFDTAPLTLRPLNGLRSSRRAPQGERGSRPHPAHGSLVPAVGLAIAAAGAQVALLATSAWLIARAAEHPPVLLLMVAVVAVRFFGIGRGVFRYGERLLGHRAALGLQSRLRLWSYRELAERMLLGRRGRDVLQRVVTDVEAVLDLVVRVSLPAIATGVVAAAGVLTAWLLSPPVGVVLLTGTMLSGLVVPWVARRLAHDADAATVPLRGDLADEVQQLHLCADEYVAAGREDDALAAVAHADHRLADAERRSAWAQGLGDGGQVLLTGLLVAGTLVVGGAELAAGRLPGVLLAVLTLLPLALGDLVAGMPAVCARLTRIRAGLRRVREVTDLPPLPLDAERNRAPAPRAADSCHITTRAAVCGYPDATEHDVAVPDFDVRPGERVVLVGPSGAGKTTVAATLLGQLPPRRGVAWVSGRVGYLAQDAYVFDTSAAENVRLGNPHADDQEVRAALTRVGLDLPLDRPVGEHGEGLSGGEARRLTLARLLVDRAEVLVLDEPTEHLDAPTTTALLRDIDRLWPSAPILLISHQPELITEVMRGVRVVELRPPGPASRTAWTADRIGPYAVRR